MKTVPLKASKREKSVPVKGLRLLRNIPAVIYGHGRENVLIQFDYQDFRKAYAQAGSNTIIDLEIDGKEHENALVYGVQHNPVTDEVTHVDLKYVRMDEAIIAHIPFEFIGVSPAVKDLAGVLEPKKHEIEVKCLPADLVPSISIDISVLVDFNTVIHIKDLVLPPKLEVLHDPEESVVSVMPPRVEEAPEAAAAAAPVEGEAAVPVEGEAATAPAAATKEGEATAKAAAPKAETKKVSK